MVNPKETPKLDERKVERGSQFVPPVDLSSGSVLEIIHLERSRPDPHLLAETLCGLLFFPGCECGTLLQTGWH